jgi:hypothetical protein
MLAATLQHCRGHAADCGRLRPTAAAGANRGLGAHVARALAAQPDAVVVAAARRAENDAPDLASSGGLLPLLAPGAVVVNVSSGYGQLAHLQGSAYCERVACVRA